MLRGACLVVAIAMPLLGQQPPQQPQQPPLTLTLAEAQRLAIQNNPLFSAAKLTAAAKTSQPTASGSCTPEGVLHACGRKAASALILGGAHASF